MRPRVVEVRATGANRLAVRFADGSAGDVALSDFVGTGGLTEALKDAAYFARVEIDPVSGSVCWPNGLDLDSHVLYSEVTGKPLPGSAGFGYKAAS